MTKILLTFAIFCFSFSNCKKNKYIASGHSRENGNISQTNLFLGFPQHVVNLGIFLNYFVHEIHDMVVSVALLHKLIVFWQAKTSD